MAKKIKDLPVGTATSGVVLKTGEKVSELDIKPLDVELLNVEAPSSINHNYLRSLVSLNEPVVLLLDKTAFQEYSQVLTADASLMEDAKEIIAAHCVPDSDNVDKQRASSQLKITLTGSSVEWLSPNGVSIGKPKKLHK